MSDYNEYAILKSEFDKIIKRRLHPSEEYERHLFFMIEHPGSHWNEMEFICSYLGQLDFEEVLPCEDEFVISLLYCSNEHLQELALDALLLWERTRYLERLRHVRFANYYLQKEFEKLWDTIRSQYDK